MVVFDSADLDSTVEGIVDAIWFNQGQVRYFSHFANSFYFNIHKPEKKKIYINFVFTPLMPVPAIQLSIGLYSTSGFIMFDQNGHHLYSRWKRSF